MPPSPAQARSLIRPYMEFSDAKQYIGIKISPLPSVVLSNAIVVQ